MQYLISFLEGIITFISPCLLPMLPVYISYFAGGRGEGGVRRTLKNAAGFVLGFTVVFTLLGALAGTLGSFLSSHRTTVNIVSGLIVVVFGLSFMGVLRLSLFRGTGRAKEVGELGFFSSILFGIVFSVGWTPCVGAFLGSALMLASQQAHAAEGIVMLLCYSLGLGIPFILSAVLIGRLKSAFDFIKRNYRTINIISGSFLILIGVAMMTGTLGRVLSLLSF
jgi:cytochrome c-type biogenesis protein